MLEALTLLEAVQVATAGAKTIATAAKKVQTVEKPQSLAELTKLTRVEPLTIISNELVRGQPDYMIDINQACLSMFCGYYLQAVAVLTKIKDVEVIRILEQLNPNRGTKGLLDTAITVGEMVSKESIATLSMENYKFNLPTKASLALENSKDGGASSNKDNIASINEISNLSVGKLLNVNIAYNFPTVKKDKDTQELTNVTEERNVSIPVNVRLLVSAIASRNIIKILASKTEETSLTERYHAWRSGRISFIKDFIFCRDLIKEHRRAIINDDTGTMQEIYRRVHNAKHALNLQNPSLATASNIFIITKEEADTIGKELMGRFMEPRVINKVFENTYAMIICVVDREAQRATFYINGCDGRTDLSFKEVKSSNKKSGPDMMEIMKAFQMGHAPQHF